ncbi:MAG: photosynthetic complex putative assembly protein PuhB [Pseudomonadota bacterium]
MDLNHASGTIGGSSPSAASAKRAIASHGVGEVPEAMEGAIYRLASGEKVLWRGKPELRRFAASVFHTNSFALYFVLLFVVAFATDGFASAATIAVLGFIGFLILWGLAFLAHKKSAYILTNQRLVILTGVALEKRISVPLKLVGSANMKPRGKGHGDIALEMGDDQRIGYLILWPHARPLRYAKPQPTLRAIPDAELVASKLADACAAFSAIDRTLAASPSEETNPHNQSQSGDWEGAPA